MIYPLLPIYLSRVLGAGAASLGIIEGVAEGVNSLLKVASGWWSDRAGRRRPLVIVGYSLSGAARPLIAAAGSWVHVLIIRALDRTGKGIRGAPRDALLAQFADASSRGRIFGFHRAMDHAGAIVGPLIATLFLYLLPGRFRLLFALTAIPGVIAVVMLFLVREPAANTRLATAPASDAAKEGTGGKDLAPTALPKRLWAVLGVILVFSLGNSADAFLLLRLTDALGAVTFLPLLWALLHVVKASLSTWGGALSDRVGRKRTIVLGWAVYALVYIAFATVTSASGQVAWFLAYGIYFALAEGAEKALEHVRAAGAVFVGLWSPVSLGDYLAGTNHVLPTAGAGRWASGLRTSHFQTTTAFAHYDRASLEASLPHVQAFAAAEGLPNHARAVEARFKAAP